MERFPPRHLPDRENPDPQAPDLESVSASSRRRRLARAESEERFRRAVMEAPFPIMIHAEDGEVLRINKVWTDLTGYLPEEIPTIGDWTERAYGERQEAVRERIDKLYRIDGRVAQGDYTITTKDGAFDFIEKPYNEQKLLDRINDAMECDRRMRRESAEREEALSRIAQLTPREREVMDLIVEGLANKQMAVRLGISEKTVEVHRSQARTKLGADSVADLVKIALRAKPRWHYAPCK